MNTYLEKIALNRLTREILKAPGKFDTEELVRRGALRSKDRFSDAIHNANSRYMEHLYKKGLGTSVVTPVAGADKFSAMAMGGYLTYPSGDIVASTPHSFLSKFISPVHKVSHSPRQRSMLDGLITRHELHERLDMGNPVTKARTNNGVMGGAFVNSKGKTVGWHNSPAVLGRESNDMVNFYKGSFDKIPHGPEFSRELEKDWRVSSERMNTIRKKTGEASSLDAMTGKRYGVDTLSPHDLDRLYTIKPQVKANLGLNFNLAHSPPGVDVAGLNSKIDKKVAGGHRLMGRISSMLRRMNKHGLADKIDSSLEAGKEFITDKFNPSKY